MSDIRDLLKYYSLPEDDSKLDHAFHLDYLLDQFHKTENPVYAIEAFIYADSNGMKIPEVVIKWQADIYRKLSSGEYAGTLDSLAGLKRGRGKDTAAAKYRRDDLKYCCMYWIWVLTNIYKISIFSASEMLVARDGEKLPDMPSADSLEQYYTHENWSEIFNKSPNAAFVIFKHKRNKDAILKTFPKDARLPSKLK